MPQRRPLPRPHPQINANFLMAMATKKKMFNEGRAKGLLGRIWCKKGEKMR
jgi:hypothetical protein